MMIRIVEVGSGGEKIVPKGLIQLVWSESKCWGVLVSHRCVIHCSMDVCLTVVSVLCTLSCVWLDVILLFD